MSKKKPEPVKCRKCGRPTTEAYWVATGEHTAAGPYCAACRPK